MSLQYQDNGYLQPGIYNLNWTDFVEIFGHNVHRKTLIQGLEKAISDLKSVGCSVIYVNGSFITKKIIPGDYDAIWEPFGVDIKSLRDKFPALIDFNPPRTNQKLRYGGEFLPLSFLSFFQLDKNGIQKGIVKIKI